MVFGAVRLELGLAPERSCRASYACGWKEKAESIRRTETVATVFDGHNPR